MQLILSLLTFLLTKFAGSGAFHLFEEATKIARVFKAQGQRNFIQGLLGVNQPSPGLANESLMHQPFRGLRQLLTADTAKGRHRNK